MVETKKTVKKKTTAKATTKKTTKNKSLAKVSKSKEKAKEKEVKERKSKTSDRTVLLKELKEKAKKLAAGIKSIGTDEIKKEFEKKRELLIPLDDYVRTGIHLGTKVITPNMRQFVYRRRADSIGVLNTTLIDEHIKKAIEILSKYEPNQIILACKREAGWQAARLFEEVTGIKAYTKKYPAGMMTNVILEDFNEPDLVIVCDPWVDKNALGDAKKTNKPVIMLADTNNFTKDANYIIPCNNKGAKSLGLVFWLLAKGYIEKRKLDIKLPSMYDFTGEDMQMIPAEVAAQKL